MPGTWFRSKLMGRIAFSLRPILRPFRRQIIELSAVTSGIFKDWESGYTYSQTLKNGVLLVGNHTYGTPKVIHYLSEQGKVEIGNFCSIADEVTIFLGGNHRWWVTTYPLGVDFGQTETMQGYSERGLYTQIGSDVWIGYGVTILGPVNIGTGAVIGARAVVASNVPPYAIVVGNPARIIRYRYEPHIVDALLQIRWWEWDDKLIEQRLADLCSEDIASFVDKYSPNDKI